MSSLHGQRLINTQRRANEQGSVGQTFYGARLGLPSPFQRKVNLISDLQAGFVEFCNKVNQFG